MSRLSAPYSNAMCECNAGWICGAHPERGWPHDDCAGPGVPCPRCQPGAAGGAERHVLPDRESEEPVEDHNG
jgi:hypothetical protein